MGQNGLSSAFSRPLSVNSETTANSSFTNILEISKGLLKRSNVDVFVNNKEDKLRLLSVSYFFSQYYEDLVANHNFLSLQ